MTSLLISDLHLTSNPRDEYRWALFPWLAGQIEKERVRHLFILGDVTEAKDYHSARLVNRVVDNLIQLYRGTSLFQIYILRGNHDGVDPKNAYFRFLGKYPSIQFIEVPYSCPLGGLDVLMLPHSSAPTTDWAGIDMHNVDLILMHATMSGAVSENGTVLAGVPAGLLATAHRAKIYSGDVHVPQQVGAVTYVGAPYPIRFGDKFAPRAVLLGDRAQARSLPVPSPPGIKRRILTAGPTGVAQRSLVAEKLGKGDQVKVRIRLAPAEYGDWPKARKNTIKACADIGVELCALELERHDPVPIAGDGKPPVKHRQNNPAETLNAWCVSNKTPKRVAALGRQLLRECASTE